MASGIHSFSESKEENSLFMVHHDNVLLPLAVVLMLYNYKSAMLVFWALIILLYMKAHLQILSRSTDDELQKGKLNHARPKVPRLSP